MSGSAAELAVTARGLTVEHDGKVVLDGVSFDVTRGRSTLLLGPGGSGKSTLLRLLSQCDGFASSRVAGSLEVASGKAGYLPQSLALAGRDVAMGAGVSPGLARAVEQVWRAHPALRHRLVSHEGAAAGEITDVDLRLLRLTEIVVDGFEFLVLDEPDTGLGPFDMEALALVLRRLLPERTVVASTRNLKFARLVADDCIFLADGRMVESASADTFFTTPRRERTRHFIKMGC